MIPAYIEARIRRAPPEGSCVVPGSTPVVAFGNARTARVATLGLNPRRVEFVENGVLLQGSNRRLATHVSLQCSDLTTAPLHMISQVLEDCDNYFQRRPYKRWFNVLEQILAACGVSYYDGTACHLDLVQWATDPTWGKLSPIVQEYLIEQDAAFLADQLRNENIRLLLVNGAPAWRQLQAASQERLTIEHTEVLPPSWRGRTTLALGRLFEHTRVVAWSTNLQSEKGVTIKLRQRLGCRAADAYKRFMP